MKLFSNFTKVVEIVPPIDYTQKFDENIRILNDNDIHIVSVVSNPMGKPKLPALYTAQYLMDYGFETIVHYPLSGRSKVIVKSDILQAASMGVNTMLILSGDSHGQRLWDGMGIVDVIKLVKSYNIWAGVAADPNNINHEYLKAKVDAGANYFQTQPVFTVESVLKFLEELQRYNLPVLLGLMIPKSQSHLIQLSQIPGVVIPDEYLGSFEMDSLEEDFIENAFEQANKIIDVVKEIIDGVYLSMPQSMFKYIKEIK
ncbi:MAG: methylenetetrahydrofolate reductase [Candidatus Cloacimonetes bacterium]|nr:methylenetetrahydrofolate reductase [Candidatus Cloacimonadota bacterium]